MTTDAAPALPDVDAFLKQRLPLCDEPVSSGEEPPVIVSRDRSHRLTLATSFFSGEKPREGETDEARLERIGDLVRELSVRPTATRAAPKLPASSPIHLHSDVIDAASFDFFGFTTDAASTTASRDCIQRYGVGSCGPRGFLGSLDTHLDLEEDAKRFVGAEAAILYSFGFSAISSAIPALASRGDVIFADEQVSPATQTGLDLSRATVRFYRHNDVAHLEELCKEHCEEFERAAGGVRATLLKRASLGLISPQLPRRYIVTEGVFEATGTIADLPEILRVARQYKFRLMLEETLSMGVLGHSGHGVTEHWTDLGHPVSPADFTVLAFGLGAAFGSIGGICVGPTTVVKHQQLSGLGYCFSASAPPFLCAAASAAISALASEPERHIRPLRKNCALLHALVGKTFANSTLAAVHTSSDGVAKCVPFVSFTLPSVEVSRAVVLLDQVRNLMLSAGVFAARPRPLAVAPLRANSGCERTAGANLHDPLPCIRVSVASFYTEAEIRTIVTATAKAFAAVLESEL
jgi:7-keto-8-aminopelargonate synthetase-like enzyme